MPFFFLLISILIKRTGAREKSTSVQTSERLKEKIIKNSSKYA